MTRFVCRQELCVCVVHECVCVALNRLWEFFETEWWVCRHQTSREQTLDSLAKSSRWVTFRSSSGYFRLSSLLASWDHFSFLLKCIGPTLKSYWMSCNQRCLKIANIFMPLTAHQLKSILICQFILIANR